MNYHEGSPADKPPSGAELKHTHRHEADFRDRRYDVLAVLELAREWPEEPEEIVPTLEFSHAVSQEMITWDDADGNPIGPYTLLHDWKAAQVSLAYAEHVEKINAADLGYPILAHRETKMVFDGLHRLTKAFLTEAPTMKVKYFD